MESTSVPAAEKSSFLKNLPGDLFGGTAAVLVALPAAIAFGLIIFAPLGAEFSGMAAVGGIMGTVVLGLIAPFIGGTKKMVSAPAAPPAAVLSVFVTEMLNKGSVAPEMIPVYVTVVSLLAGLVQMMIGVVGGGKVIKYIPFPVVAGYLGGVGYLILAGQSPKFLGLPKGVKIYGGILTPEDWKWQSIVIGLVTILTMIYAPKIIKAIPAAILALVMGIVTYFIIALFDPALLSLDHNPFVIGKINASITDLKEAISSRWSQMLHFDFSLLASFTVPVLTLAVLLSIDTLKTCVILDAMTYTRHNSNKEMIGHGIANMSSALLCGIPGSGTMGPTLVNINSGAKSKMSSIVFGVMALIILLVLGKLIAWIPHATLAGVLLVVGFKMFDKQIFSLLKHKSTVIDFFVVLAVVVSAVSMSLVVAAGVGIAMAIILFLRDQMRTSVIHRNINGAQINSKKNRPGSEHDLIDAHGKEIQIMELQGQLFFGTTDQLYTKCDAVLGETRFLILDMRRLQSIDFTGVNLLKQLLARLKANKGKLLISSIPISLPTGLNLTVYLKGLGLEDPKDLLFFDDMDSALSYAEDETLKVLQGDISHEDKALKLEEIELLAGLPAEAMKTIASCVEEKHFGANELVFKKNDKGDEIYFVGKGNVRIVLPISATQQYLLVNVSRGSVFGEMAFIDKVKRSADAVTDVECVLYVLSRTKFEGVAAKHPEISGVLFERLALLMANRIRQSNKEIKSLQES